MYFYLQLRAAVLVLAVAFISTAAPGSTTTFLDVRSYGAKGDGVTDDQPAIQRALSAAQATNASVYFGPGTYLLVSSAMPAGQLALSSWGASYSVNLVGNN